MTQHIRRVLREHAQPIVQLRMQAYRSSREFRLLQPECLEWTEVDDQEVVIAAYDATGNPVSTTRGGIVLTSQEAARHMGCSVDLPSWEFPALLLGRGATLHDAGRIGLHSTLRYYFLLAVHHTNIHSALGMVYYTAPRTNLMRDIGYEFYSPEKVWDEEVEALQPVLVAHLKASQFESACHHLKGLLAETLSKYPWVGDPIGWPK